MLSKERIRSLLAAHGEDLLDPDEVTELMRSWLSVQEGLKDAREVLEKVRAVSTIDEESNGELAAFFEIEDTQAAQLIAAFALKQKGEVVWEGNGRVGSIDMYKVIYPEGLYRDDVPPNGEYHVTISIPQQEQE